MPFSIVRKNRRPADMLPEGWQFYSRPTNLEPPGTIFGIDSQGHRFIVERLPVRVDRVPEPGASSVRTVETRVEILARLLGLDLPSAEVGPQRAMIVGLEIEGSERQSTSDAEVDKVLAAFLARLEFLPGNRYFLIREVRSATAMTFRLTKEDRARIGGDAPLDAAATFDISVGAPTAEASELTRQFPERLGVMFLPEEIAPKWSGLARATAPELGRVPVRESLDWVEPDFAVERVFYGTNRKASTSQEAGEQYSAKRGTMAYGTCEVSIPRDHRMGDLEAPSIWKFEFRQNAAKHVMLMKTVETAKVRFFGELSAKLNASSGAAFLFVHGYNVSFEDAARRTAQIRYDLAFDGAAIFYSWPSQAALAAYTVDEANIEWAQPDLREFIGDLLAGGVLQLYVIGHSMGNRATARALSLLLEEQPALRQRLKEVILTAPDIDADVFRREIAPALTGSGCPVTLYASTNDLALAASKKVHGSPRAGDAGGGLVIVNGIETIDASGIDTSFIGHSYFAEARSVLSDIFYLVKHGQRAGDRFGLRPIDGAQGRHWRFKK